MKRTGKQIIALTSACIFLFHASVFAATPKVDFQVSPEINLGLDSYHVDNSDEPMDKRYIYKWERTSTIKGKTLLLTASDARNMDNLQGKINSYLTRAGAGLTIGGLIANSVVATEFGVASLANSLAQAHRAKLLAYENGTNHASKIEFWEGRETQFKIDLLTDKKTPVRKRIILTSQSLMMNPDGSYGPVGSVTYRFNLK